MTEVVTEEERTREEIQIAVDEVAASEAGVTPWVIARTVDFALRGARLPYLKEGEREVPVWAQFREEDRKTRANLDNVAILTDRGQLAPLRNLVSFKKALSPKGIQRINGKNVTTLTLDAPSKDLNQVIRDIKEVLAAFRLPRGYSAEMGEAFLEFETDLSNFATAMLLSSILIYLVMAALFESYLLPLSILWSIPMAFIGIWWLLYITDTPADSVALIGIILMGGIVVNNAIVIVDHINQLRNTGLDRYPAILQAGRDRFRPVMMTALTTILGCVPIALGGTIASAVSFTGLGRALIGGLLSGTLLTLVVVPVFYTLIDVLRLWCLSFFANLKSCFRPRSSSI